MNELAPEPWTSTNVGVVAEVGRGFDGLVDMDESIRIEVRRDAGCRRVESALRWWAYLLMSPAKAQANMGAEAAPALPMQTAKDGTAPRAGVRMTGRVGRNGGMRNLIRNAPQLPLIAERPAGHRLRKSEDG